MNFKATLVRDKKFKQVRELYNQKRRQIVENKSLYPKERCAMLDKIGQTRDLSLELDSFIHNKDTLEKLKQMPKADELHINAFNFDDGKMELYYKPKSKKSAAKVFDLTSDLHNELTKLEVSQKDGKIDTSKVRVWFDILYDYIVEE